MEVLTLIKNDELPEISIPIPGKPNKKYWNHKYIITQQANTIITFDNNEFIYVLYRWKLKPYTSGFLFKSSGEGNMRLKYFNIAVHVIFETHSYRQSRRLIKLLKAISKHDITLLNRLDEKFWNFLTIYICRRNFKLSTVGEMLQRYEINLN